MGKIWYINGEVDPLNYGQIAACYCRKEGYIYVLIFVGFFRHTCTVYLNRNFSGLTMVAIIVTQRKHLS